MTFEKPIVQFYTKEGEVTAGDCALYVKENSEPDFAESLISLLEDKGKRESMGLVGRRRIEEELCWDRQKAKMKEAYDHIA